MRMLRRVLPLVPICLVLCVPMQGHGGAKEKDTYLVGVAKIDITPDYPIRLSGFGFRRTESEGITQKIWAKALAIGSDEQGPAVLIAVDNLGVPYAMTQEIVRRLAKHGVRPERLAVTATHTHTAPMLRNVAPTLFGQPIPKEQQERIDRYTSEFTDNLEKVALAALKDRRPSRLSFGIGKSAVAKNRRPKGGPVDHDLPVLAVRDLDGKVRGVYVTYACHCVTLSDNKISGDWAGFAQELIEVDFPGAVALVSIGCGADQNPVSGVTVDKVDIARGHGAEVAREARRLVQGFLAPIKGPLTAKTRVLQLPLAELPERKVWEEKAKRNDAIGYHARVNLARLDRGDKLRDKIDYPIQTWTFGDSLAMVFLPGEVVVDYGLRLKKELDGLRLWINAYANDAPCYIPSERILKEGGYEGGGAMIYYDVPVPFKPGLEQRIIDTVHELVAPAFKSPFNAKKTDTRPLSPQQSLTTIQTKSELQVELVAAEPLVIDPVAIDWAPDGKLWVAEMHDYPSGVKGDFKPGGRIKLLESTRGDGKYDKATIFLDNIPFPTGVTTWRKGVLVCAAPDILYAVDTDGDGKADLVRKVFSGFGTHNYQARVNSLVYGLDGWVYGSCGMFGGTIECFPLNPALPQRAGRKVVLGDRDFRMKPDAGELEPATGRTQQGRVRDDWGNWFGCDNSTLCRHYPLADHYLRRNPHLAPPAAAVLVPDYPDSHRLYPADAQLQLFKLSGPPGRVTAACGLEIYRDDWLGPEHEGNAFVCESVNLLVHRLVVSPKGSTFSGRRAKDESASEFLVSTDTWFRPVQVRTGPDGAFWVVDMYRYVIEHPRWIPPEQLAQVDLRAGSTMGRIYRIYPKDKKLRAVPRLEQMDAAGLARALDTANGWQRDMAMQLLLWRQDKTAIKDLEKAARHSRRPQTRAQALCALDSLGELSADLVERSLSDKHAGVRRHAVRLAERFLEESLELALSLRRLENDPDPQVRLQLAYSLGEWQSPLAGVVLARLALSAADDPYLTAAVLSSANADNLAELLSGVTSGEDDKVPANLVRHLCRTAAGVNDARFLGRFLWRLFESQPVAPATWQMAALTGILEAAPKNGPAAQVLAERVLHQRITGVYRRARGVALEERASLARRLIAVNLLGREPSEQAADIDSLKELLVPQNAASLQEAALAALGRIADDRVAGVLTAGWRSYSPALQARLLDLLLSRPAWQRHLLDSIVQKQVPAAQIDPARRQRLLAHKDEATRALAAKLFAGAIDTDRQKVIDDYRAALTLAGDAGRGLTVFQNNCASCHRLGNMGHAVGPDLAALANKSPAYLLIEILDPSRNLDSRYVDYLATTRSGRVYGGILAGEGAASITLRGQDGREETLLRGELEELINTGKSLMPDGIEKKLSRQDMADLIAFLNDGKSDDVQGAARQILDDKVPAAKRQALIQQHLAKADELIRVMTADLTPETKEEYRRIPWIWRVAVAAGRKNDAQQIARILDVSLPAAGQPLRDWQAVVIGGGVINGISLQGVWPQKRLDEILKDNKELARRWQASLPQAAAMADNDKVPTGTRYDALRMIALESWDRAGEQLKRYLAKGVHAELQMGAVSGLSDVDRPEAAPLLLSALPHLSAENRRLALDALVRTESRMRVLLDAIEAGTLAANALSERQSQRLRNAKDETVLARALKVLTGK